MKKNLTMLFMGFLVPMLISAQTKLETSALTSTYKYSTSTTNPYGIHDPSVVWDSNTQKFYVYGSHYAGAKSNDLRNWTGIFNYYKGGYDSANAYKVFKSNPTHTVKRCLPGSTVQEEVTLGSYDASAFASIYASSEASWVEGCQWAPDIVYNPNSGKWNYYLSINGDNWASVIVLLTSNSPEGPFTYEAPIVFGGFNNQSYNGKKVDYKNTDLEIVLGTQSSLPGRYNVTTHWGTYWPNCIDPCVFFDEEGEMWIAYGSWSGGIWMLKLDKETGLRDYTYTYSGTSSTANANATSDAYFGLKIAGGYYVSGEGPYIQHIGNYYFLFMSYGGFAPDGGYEMRIFRSSSPTGPYKDASGNVATYTSGGLNYGPNANTNKGMKILGSYNGWGEQTMGECAQGHNSACQDDQGRSFVVYHTKFNNGNAAHAMRVRQLFLNENDWLCAAPFEFNGETLTDADIASSQPWSVEDIEGDYQMLMHPYKLDHVNYAEATPVTIHLSADGKVSGKYTGTWKYSQDGKSYIQIKLGTSTYYGIVSEQNVQGSNANLATVTSTVKALCFSAVNAAGVPIWGYKWQPQYAIAYNYSQHSSVELKRNANVKSNINIVFDPVHNTTLKWTSSNPDVLDETGKYNPTDVDETVTMTSRLSAGNYYWENSYNTTCSARQDLKGDPYSGLVAYYNFDETPTKNVLNADQSATYKNGGTTSVPVLTTDYSRFGKICHQYAGAKTSSSYTRIPNPLKGADNLRAFTVSMWVKRADNADYYGALWGFFNSTIVSLDGTARLFFTGNSYLGFNDNTGNWFDLNHPDTKVITQIDKSNWRLITVTYSEENGYRIYRDDRAYLSTNLKYSGSVDEKVFDRTLVTDFVATAAYFYLGAGGFWGSAEAEFDDLMIYNRELSSDDVASLYTELTRVNALDSGTITGIDNVVAEESAAGAPQGIFDLTGRRVGAPSKGIYIVNGKKVLFK